MYKKCYFFVALMEAAKHFPFSAKTPQRLDTSYPSVYITHKYRVSRPLDGKNAEKFFTLK